MKPGRAESVVFVGLFLFSTHDRDKVVVSDKKDNFVVTNNSGNLISRNLDASFQFWWALLEFWCKLSVPMSLLQINYSKLYGKV